MRCLRRILLFSLLTACAQPPQDASTTAAISSLRPDLQDDINLILNAFRTYLGPDNPKSGDPVLRFPTVARTRAAAKASDETALQALVTAVAPPLSRWMVTLYDNFRRLGPGIAPTVLPTDIASIEAITDPSKRAWAQGALRADLYFAGMMDGSALSSQLLVPGPPALNAFVQRLQQLTERAAFASEFRVTTYMLEGDAAGVQAAESLTLGPLPTTLDATKLLIAASLATPEDVAYRNAFVQTLSDRIEHNPLYSDGWATHPPLTTVEGHLVIRGLEREYLVVHGETAQLWRGSGLRVLVETERGTGLNWNAMYRLR